MAVLLEAAAGGLLLKLAAEATEWRWQASDALSDSFAASVVERSCSLGWSRREGRHVRTTRRVQRGELLLRVRALATVSLTTESPPLSPAAERAAAELGVDAPVISLALSLLRKPGASALARSLLSHACRLSSEEAGALRRLARDICRSSQAEERPSPGRVGSEGETRGRERLCARIGVVGRWDELERVGQRRRARDRGGGKEEEVGGVMGAAGRGVMGE